MISGVTQQPVDEASGTSQALSMRSEQRDLTQYARTIDEGIGWLATADTSIRSAVTRLRRARDLTVQAGSGAMSDAGRAAIAIEIESIRDGLLTEANATYRGRHVVAGTSDAAAAFSARPGHAGNGEPTGSLDGGIPPDATVGPEADGSAVFGSGTDSVFALLDSIAADVRPGIDAGGRLTEIDTRRSAMLSELARVGSRAQRLTTARVEVDLRLQELRTSLAGVEDIDLRSTIVDLQSQEIAHQGALGATARVLQPTLMDFLR